MTRHYQGTVQPLSTGVTPIANDLLPILTAGIGGANGGKGGAVPTSFSGSLIGNAVLAITKLDSISNSTTRPKAFLNWMVVGEDYVVATGSANHVGAMQIPICNSGDTMKQMTGLNRLVCRRNGWIYVYVSNETAQDVYFDNLVINLTHGPLVEQKDYYAFGMQNPALSTKALKANYYVNRSKFNEGSELQNKEFSDSSGWEDYDFNARTYDPQIGRFLQQDPLADFNEQWSSYCYAQDNAVRYSDPSGLDTAGNLEPVTVVGYRRAPPPPSPDVAGSVGAAPTSSSIAAGPAGAAAVAVTAIAITTEVGGGTLTLTGLSSLPLAFGIAIAYSAYTIANTPNELPVINIPGDIGIGAPSHSILNNRVKSASGVKPTPPPYPLDPTKAPAPGWEWRGRAGSIPGSKQGSWINEKTHESLWNDSDHSEPKGEHYYYTDPTE